jgi:tRNA A-37 threonylcarbamoyl transferase component Bud32
MRSRMLFAADPEWALLGEQFGEQPGDPMNGPGFDSVKVTRRTRAGFLVHAGREAFVKRVDSAGCGKGILARVFGSRARRALRGAKLLAEGGFAHPRPLLLMETIAGGSIRASYMATEPLRGAKVLSRFALGRARSPGLRRTVSKRVAAEIRRLHDTGIYTRDLQETNLMIEDRGGELMLYFLDFEDFRRVSQVSLETRLLNLVHLDRSVGRFVSRSLRLRFFYDYLGRRLARDEARELMRQYAAVRARVERRARRRLSVSIPRKGSTQSRDSVGLS